MTESYYCETCKKFVLTRLDMFRHPHEGMKTCLICCKCRGMVYLKKQGGNYAPTITK